MSGAIGRRCAAILSAVLLVGGLAAVAGTIDDTQAAWSDATHASAVATGGTWSTTPTKPGCTAMNANGTPKSGGYCSILSVTVESEWGVRGDRTRNYVVTFRSNAGSGYIQFTANLAQTRDNFSWPTAGLVAPAAQASPNSGWTCANLPLLTAETPSNWGWGNSSSIYFQIAEKRTSTNVTCG